VDLGAYSSRQTLMTGHATKKAAEAVKAQILEAIADLFQMPLDAFTLRDGKVLGTEKNPEKLKLIRDQYRREHRAFADVPKDGPLTFQEINRYLYNQSGQVIGKGTYSPGEIQEFKDWKGSAVGSSPAYSTQTCIAEVTVDLDTGKLTVDKVTLAHDCGFALNRTAVEGQMEGSMCHGLSETLFEEMLFDDKGHLINRTLGDYKIATALDVPELDAIIIETNEPAGPFGAKEVGEGCIIPILPAIINAINDACGAVIMDLPVTSEKILMALKAKEDAKTERFVTEIPPNALKLLDIAREITQKWEQNFKK
jgi:4-hydroxybenzoyl-CoA reductase subunit alpha